jgi:cellulose synthase operon protein B
MRLVSAIAIAISLASLDAGAAEAVRRAGTQGTSVNFAAPEWRRPLSVTTDNAEFVGEAVSREFVVHLTAGEATRPAKIRLAYLNAISVMPETFKLTVKVNDTVVGGSSVQTSGQPESLNLDIPLGLLEPGFNAVRVSVRQTHRVDCSPGSTYELWTRLLPEQSEIAIAGAQGAIRDLRDLPAVKPSRDGTTSIRVRMTDGRDPADVGRASRAVQSATLLGFYQNPVVEVDSDGPADSGLDVVVGTAAAVERATGLRVPGAGPRHHILHNLQDGRVTLVVTGGTTAELEEALDGLAERAAAAAPTGSPAGVRALRNLNGRQVVGGETVTLSELGVESEPFRGRLQRQTLKLQLPPDLLVADYGRVTLATDAVYGPNLSPGSKLVVRVNGASIADVTMSNAAGDVLDKRVLQLPMTSFKPGLNTVDLEADTRTKADDACGLSALADQHERFLLSGTSELTIPALARIGTLPSISSIVPGGLAQLSPSREIHVFVPKARVEAVEASLTMLAKMASVSRQQAKPVYGFDRAPEGASHVLAFGAYVDMPEATIRAAGLDPVTLGKPGQDLQADAARTDAAAMPIRVASIGDQLSLPRAEPFAKADPEAMAPSREPLARTSVQPTDLLSAMKAREGWSMQGRLGDVLGTLRAQGMAAFDRLMQFGAASMRRAGLASAPASAGLEVSDAATFVVAQGARTKDLEAGWRSRIAPTVESTTVFLAPSAGQLASSVSEILSGPLWQQFVGKAAVYHDNVIDTQTSEQILLVPTAPLDIRNVRLIAAGWLSRNIPIHLAALLGIFLVLTLVMHRALRASGVREP